jgi:magnesium transporter
MIYFTELDNLPTYDVKGHYIGRLSDLTVNPSQNPDQVAYYLVKTPKNELLCIPRDQMQSISVRAIQTIASRDELPAFAPDESLIRVKKDVLDQQIIDVTNRKVVRVTDVDFDIQPSERHTSLRVIAVNIGWAAGVRRMLQGLFAKHTIRLIAGRFPTKTIPWEVVNLIESDPARRIKLRISYDRLGELHPADLADILEELSHDDQKSMIESLDEETAAQALSEIPTRMQVSLLESVSTGKAADLVEEMAPDEAADVLQELSPETSAQVLANMETEEAEEVRELLGFEENTAGGLMTTEFVLVGDSASVEGATVALKIFEGEIESIHCVYLIDADCVLTGSVPLGRIILADRESILKDLSSDPLISVPFHADEKTVVNLFQKYNLLTLPVVDDNGRLLGVITADDALDVVVNHH